MKSLICQAFFAWSAGRCLTDSLPATKNRNIHNMYMHAVCNKMDDCKSYMTHKYFDSERVNELFGYPSGGGAYGAWWFKDNSLLICFTDDQYAIVLPLEDGETVQKMVSMKEWEIKCLRGSREEDMREFDYS